MFRISSNNVSQSLVILLGVFAFFCFGTHDAISKISGLSVGFAMAAIMIQLWQSFFILTYFSFKREWYRFNPKDKKTTILYVILQVIGMLGFYFAVLLLPLVELFIILLMRPVFSSVLAVIFLNEKISKYHMAALLLGLLATLITFQFWDADFLSENLNWWGVAGGMANVIAMSVR